MGSPDINVLTVARMQIFTISCARISVSHNTVSVQLNHGRVSTRASALRLRDTGHYRFASEKLLNPANPFIRPFYVVKKI
jgi:hypothetical protein